MGHRQSISKTQTTVTSQERLGIDIDALLEVAAKALSISQVRVALVQEYVNDFANFFNGCIHVVDSSDEAQQAVLSQKTVIVSPSSFFCETPERRFFAGVPLIVNQHIIGLVYALDNQCHALDSKELEPLLTLGEHLSTYLSLLRQQLELQNEHQLIENSPAVIMTWRLAGGLSLNYASSNLEHLFGLPVDQLRQHKAIFEDFIDPKSLNNFAFLMKVHRDGVQVADAQFELRNPNGESFWVKMLSKAFYQQGKLDAVHALLIDYTAKRFMEQKLRDTNQQMRLLLEASDLATWDYNVVEDHLTVNKYCCDMLGLEPDLFNSSHHFWFSLLHPADRENEQRAYEQHLQGKDEAIVTTYRVKHANGDWVWLETYGKVVERDAQRRATRIAGTHRNVTLKKKTELVQDKQRQLLSFINKAMSVYLQYHDLSDACRKVLPELIDIADSEFAFIGQMRKKEGKDALFIHATAELAWNEQTKVLLEMYHNRELYFTNLDNLFGSVIRTESIVISNEPSTHSDSKGTPKGHPKIFRFMGLPIKLQGNVVGMIGFANKLENYTEQDAEFLFPLTEALAGLYYSVEMEEARNEAEKQLKKMAMCDPLTGLFNRRAFAEHFQQMCTDKRNYTLAILDIDFFKQINDQHGHLVGDEVLQFISRQLTDILQPADVIARFGGEEFVMLIQRDSQELTNQQLEQMRTHFTNCEICIEKGRLKVTVSIGATFVSSSDGCDMQAQIEAADNALYQAKACGRNRVVWG